MAKLTKKSTSPTPITTGELKNIDELYLVSEAMVAMVAGLIHQNILNAVATLLDSFDCLNMVFLKGSCGVREKIVAGFRAHALRLYKCKSAIVCGKCFV